MNIGGKGVKCSGCGVEVSEGMSFCPRCGRQLGIPPFYGMTLGQRSQQSARTSDRGLLLLVIAIVIIVVLLPIVLSAILYFMVLGFGSDGGVTPFSSLAEQTVPNGERFTFSAFSIETVWTDITVVLSDGFNTVTWTPSATNLDNGSWTTARYPAQVLGEITVFCNVTDTIGDGRIDQGDFFTLTTGSQHSFSTAQTYTVAIIYDPNGDEVCRSVFWGM